MDQSFNAEVFVAAPHAVAMQFDLFGRGRVVIGLRAAGSAKGNFWLDSACLLSLWERLGEGAKA